jgi:hypothetical protein
MQKIRLVLISVVIILVAFRIAPAQSDEKKLEVGGQFTSFRVLTRSISTPNARLVRADRMTTVEGFGGRFGYNVMKHVTLEAEVNFFSGDSDLEAGRKLQGLFGVKAGWRFKKVGVFVKARPGFIRFQKGDYAFGSTTGDVCPLSDPSPLICFHPVPRNSFALDLGGVVEIYPSKRTFIRVDVGDTIIRLDARIVATLRTFGGAGGSEVVEFAPKETVHKFQSSIGFGFRF